MVRTLVHNEDVLRFESLSTNTCWVQKIYIETKKNLENKYGLFLETGAFRYAKKILLFNAMNFMRKIIMKKSANHFLHLLNIEELVEILRWSNDATYAYRQREILCRKRYLKNTLSNLLVPMIWDDDDLNELENIEISLLDGKIKKSLLLKFDKLEE